MNRIKILVSIALVSILAFTATGKAFNDVVECDGAISKVKAVTVKGYQQRLTTYNTLTNPPGQLDPDPILRTTVVVRGGGCLTAHFSTIARPIDNWVDFQVRINGNGFVNEPLEGHSLGLDGLPVPTIWSIEETDLNATRIVSHDFFKRVPPGVYELSVVMSQGNGFIQFNPDGSPKDAPSVLDPTLIIYYN